MYYMCQHPVDMRKGINGLYNLVERMNHLNLFDYLADILDRTATWQPNTPLEKYRNLLPDRWQPSTED